MARTPRPNYYAPRRLWWCTLDGRRVVLARGHKDRTRKEAEAVFRRLLAERDAAGARSGPGPLVGEVCDRYYWHA